VRLTVGAANAGTGDMRYFDSRDERLGVEHVLASPGRSRPTGQ
jgi:NTE family protein